MPYNDRLFRLLQELDDAELQSLWQTALKCEPAQEDFHIVTREMKVALISAEWRAAHGHTLLNMRRGSHELAWKRILIDVADKLKPGWTWTAFKVDDAITEEELEQVILRFFDERAQAAWSAMSDAEKQKLANQMSAELSAADRLAGRLSTAAGARGVSVASLGAGIGAGLVSGTGALLLMQGTSSVVVGGLMGGALYQLGLWVVVRVFGVWSGAQLAVGGGAAAVGGALLSAPAAVAFAANALMSTSYRKTIPATLLLLTAHELRRQLSELEEGSR